MSGTSSGGEWDRKCEFDSEWTSSGNFTMNETVSWDLNLTMKMTMLVFDNEWDLGI